MLRDADGTVTTAHETDRTGLFSEATWPRLVTQAGFVASAETERTTGNRAPRTIFIGQRA